MRLLYGFLSFAITEAILFVFFTSTSLLPFLGIWKGFAPEAPASAYVPHAFLSAILLGVIITVVRRYLCRPKGGKDADLQS